jgi:hypothetical protein
MKRVVTPLLAATGLLIGGAVQYAADQTVTGIALLSAGLITLGAWIGEAIRDNDNDPRP